MRSFITVSLIIILFCFAKCGSAKPVIAAQTTDSIYTYKTASQDGIGKFYFGREIAWIMSASGAAWLDRDERQKEENTTLALKKIDVPANGTIADIGAGTGYYTFKLAPKVPQGKVYAVEVQDQMIQYLNDNKQKQHAANVEVVKGNDTLPNLPEKSVDLAIMVDVYHELEYPHEMLQALRKSLKKDGKILLIEYRGEDPAVPIKALHKTSIEQLNKELEANGFKLSFDGEFLPLQHFLLYKMVE